LFGFGSNIYGQIGYLFEKSSNFFSNLMQIKFFDDKKILNFCCGENCSFVLTGWFFDYFFKSKLNK
jgi:hypothetical protein